MGLYLRIEKIIKLYKGDCLEIMDELIEQGVVVDATELSLRKTEI